MKRVRSLSRVTNFCLDRGLSFPCTEEQMYGFLCAERDSGAAPSRMNAVLEACVFARDVRGVVQLEPIIKSRRCSGTAAANIHNTIKQSTPLTVQQLKKLHDVLSNDVEDWNKAFAGMILFCVYARSRWMDPQHSDKFCTASLHPDKLYDQQIGWLLLSNWLNDFNSSGHFALAFGDALAFFFGLGFGFGSASFLSAVDQPVSWDFATPFGNGSKCKVTRGSYMRDFIFWSIGMSPPGVARRLPDILGRPLCPLRPLRPLRPRPLRPLRPSRSLRPPRPILHVLHVLYVRYVLYVLYVQRPTSRRTQQAILGIWRALLRYNFH